MDKRYAIGQLVELTGTARRVIRYYIAQGLLEPPLGAGRGHYYTAKHLQRLKQIIALKHRGLTLEEIRRMPPAGDDEKPAGQAAPMRRSGRAFESLRNELGNMQSYALTVAGECRSAERPTTPLPFEEEWIRIRVTAGFELHIHKHRLGLSENELREIVQKIFDMLHQRPY